MTDYKTFFSDYEATKSEGPFIDQETLERILESIENPRVFISYARRDGLRFAFLLTRELNLMNIPTWLDKLGLEGGIPWWEQIKDAIDKVDVLILVATPLALESEYVKKEWMHARRVGARIYPVQIPGMEVLGSNEFEELPEWMKKAQLYNLADESQWQLLIADLKTEGKVDRIPFMAKDLPEEFIERPTQVGLLKQHLLTHEKREAIAITTSLIGSGGFGKTTLAQAICNDEEIITAFDSGILWVTLGQKPDVLRELTVVYQELTGNRKIEFLTIDDAVISLKHKLRDKACLLVIDDVWQYEHLQPFLEIGENSAKLITTRKPSIPMEHGFAYVEVDEMELEESVELLKKFLGTEIEDSQPLYNLAHRLGNYPLLLELAGSILRSLISAHSTVEEALQWLNNLYEHKGVTAYDKRDATARDEAISKTLDISLELLKPNEMELYKRLSIIPEGISIPLTSIMKLWGADEFQTKDLLLILANYSLIKFNFQDNTVTMHGVVKDYIGEKLENSAEVVNLFIQNIGNPFELGEGLELNLYTYLLIKAGRTEDLHHLLALKTENGENAWFALKRKNGDTFGYATDIAEAREIAEEEVRDSIRREEHPTALSLEIKYALIESSLNSLMSNIPSELIPALVEKGIWTVAKAVQYISMLPLVSGSEDTRDHTFQLLATYLSSKGYYNEAYSLITSIKNPEILVESLLKVSEIATPEYQHIFRDLALKFYYTEIEEKNNTEKLERRKTSGENPILSQLENIKLPEALQEAPYILEPLARNNYPDVPIETINLYFTFSAETLLELSSKSSRVLSILAVRLVFEGNLDAGIAVWQKIENKLEKAQLLSAMLSVSGSLPVSPDVVSESIGEIVKVYNDSNLTTIETISGESMAWPVYRYDSWKIRAINILLQFCQVINSEVKRMALGAVLEIADGLEDELKKASVYLQISKFSSSEDSDAMCDLCLNSLDIKLAQKTRGFTIIKPKPKLGSSWIELSEKEVISQVVEEYCKRGKVNRARSIANKYQQVMTHEKYLLLLARITFYAKGAIAEELLGEIYKYVLELEDKYYVYKIFAALQKSPLSNIPDSLIEKFRIDAFEYISTTDKSHSRSQNEILGELALSIPQDIIVKYLESRTRSADKDSELRATMISSLLGLLTADDWTDTEVEGTILYDLRAEKEDAERELRRAISLIPRISTHFDRAYILNDILTDFIPTLNGDCEIGNDRYELSKIPEFIEYAVAVSESNEQRFANPYSELESDVLSLGDNYKDLREPIGRLEEKYPDYYEDSKDAAGFADDLIHYVLYSYKTTPNQILNVVVNWLIPYVTITDKYIDRLLEILELTRPTVDSSDSNENGETPYGGYEFEIYEGECAVILAKLLPLRLKRGDSGVVQEVFERAIEVGNDELIREIIVQITNIEDLQQTYTKTLEAEYSDDRILLTYAYKFLAMGKEGEETASTILNNLIQDEASVSFALRLFKLFLKYRSPDNSYTMLIGFLEECEAVLRNSHHSTIYLPAEDFATLPKDFFTELWLGSEGSPISTFIHDGDKAQALKMITALGPILYKLGGKQAILEIIKAIRDNE